MNRSRLRSCIVFITALGSCIGAWTIYQTASEHANSAPPPTSAPQPFPVETTSIHTRTIQERIELVGSFEPHAAITVRTRVAGHITTLPFDLGDRVTTAELIARLDDGEHRNLLAGSVAAMKSAEVELRISRAESEFPIRRLEFVRRMFKKGHQSLAQVELTERNLDIAKARVELAKLRVLEAKSRMEQDRTALANTRIVAPLTGFVAQRYVDVGDFVNPNEPVLDLVDMSVVVTVVRVVEKDYDGLKVGQAAKLQVDGFNKPS